MRANRLATSRLLAAAAFVMLAPPTAIAAPLSAPAAGLATPAAQDVTRATLANGLRVVIVRNTLAPVVTTQMNYLVGSDEVPSGFPGTAHAVEHMMFRGSPGLNKDQIAALATNMGGQFNADTTEGVTQYFFTVPVQDLDVALRIHAIRMKGVDMAPAQWAKERGAIEQEVSGDMSNPTFKFYTQLRAQLFAGTPYAHTPLGTRASFDATTAADLKAFHDRWYAPNNAILVIAGDVDPKATLEEVRKLFAPIARKALPARPTFTLRPVAAQTINLPSDLPYGLVLMAYRMPGLHDADYPTALVLSQALASQRGALSEMGLSGKALYGDFSADFLSHGGLAYAEGVFARGGSAAPVMQAMRTIMQQTASQGVPADLVDAAKRRAIADLDYQSNSVEGQANAWSQALAFADVSSPDAIKAAIAAVTPEQVNALAHRLFVPEQAVTAILTPQASGKAVSSKGFGGAENFGTSPTGAVTLPDWAKAAFARLPEPKTAIHPTAFTLANGLKVIVQPETVSHTVEVFGSIKTNPDMQVPAGKEGVADVLSGMFDYGVGGDHPMGRDQFQAALDAISAHESAGDSFSLAVPSADFADGMTLLAQNQLHPAMPENAFRIVQQREAANAAGTLLSPDFRNAMELEKALLPAGDPALRHPDPATIKALTLGDVKQYFQAAYRPDMTTIVVVGDVTPQQARTQVERTFGSWQAHGPKPDADYPPVPLNRHAVQFHTPSSTAVQDSVTMAQQVALNDRDPARFALNAGNLVLSGGFYAARLTRDLREKRGLVYTVSSGLELERQRGRFAVEFGSDPDKVGPAHDLIVRDLRQMQQSPVTSDELHQVKSMLLRQLPLGESSFGGIAGQLLQYSQEDKPLDSDMVAARQYAALTPADIQNAFRRYIRPDDFVTAVEGPAPKS